MQQTTVTHWTIQDLAVYCEHCLVIAVQDGDKYCRGCANEVTEYMAALYDEQRKVNEGWF